MANRHRGEIRAVLDGSERTLCLTLGALAELEEKFRSDNLMALARRFEGGRLSADDLICIIGAGLRGGGATMTNDDVAAMQPDGGIGTFARIAADLLKAAFSVPDENLDQGADPGKAE